MKDYLNLKIKGKFTFPSEYSEVPEGALLVAKNVVIDRDSTLQPRRGFDKAFELTGDSDRPNKIFEFQDKLIVHYKDDTLAYYDSSTLTDYTGTIEAIDSLNPIRADQANENFYFTTSKGIKKLDAYNGVIKDTGVTKAIDFSGALDGSSGFLSDGKSVAYRVLYGIEDANKNLLLGSPSQRLLVANGSGGTRNVDLTISIPDGITDSHFVQIYRSAESDEPNDEMQLCYEAIVTSAEITAGEISVTDNLPEDILGGTLYTSPSQEGIASANEPPPLARDIATFKGHLFLANTTSKHRRQIAILAADGSGSPGEALQVDDVITIAGVTFTGKATTTVASRQFAVSTDSSPAIAIRETALELVKCINAATVDVYAYYISGFGQVPGKILLEGRTADVGQFSVIYTPNSHTGNPFNPQLPPSGTSVSSSNDRFRNGLFFSKFLEPEAVPIANFFRVGSAEDQILRIIPLRDSLFILKERGGVFRLSGEDSGSFRIDEFDSTVRLIGSETAQKLNNAIYFLSDQGVVQCTETGISVISRPIEDEILNIFAISDNLTVPKQYATGASYETERKYLLAVPTSSTDTAGTKIHTYNTFTQAWTEWTDLNVKHMHVFTGDNKLYLASGDLNLIRKEKKTFTAFDYADYLSEETISAIADPTHITITQSDTMTKGDIIYQSDSQFSIIKDIDAVTGDVELFFDGGLETGDATLLGAIDVDVEWIPVHASMPHISKHFSEVIFIFGRAFLLEATGFFATEISQSQESFDITGTELGIFGFFEWGATTWGGASGRLTTRTYVPREKARANLLRVGFRHRMGYSDFRLNGLAVLFEPQSQRFSK